MESLGIDKAQQIKNPNRNWNGIRNFFKGKIPFLQAFVEENKAGTSQDKLIAAVFSEIVDTLHRQLAVVPFLNEDNSNDDILLAPLTNSGCESRFATLTNSLKVSGGSTKLKTLSDKEIVRSNNYIGGDEFKNLLTTEKVAEWKWARNSQQAKAYKKLTSEFLDGVKTAQSLAFQHKKILKEKKAQRTLKLLDQCKVHGGPLTTTSLHLLDSLSLDQLLVEVYLRCTIAPSIRQKRRVKGENGKYKMENFTISELCDAIKNAIKPENDLTQPIGELLQDIFK